MYCQTYLQLICKSPKHHPQWYRQLLTRSNHSNQDNGPLQSLMDELNVNLVNLDEIKIDEEQLNIYVPNVIPAPIVTSDAK